MFGSKKKETPGIDPVQREMIENARRRIKQKRGLFTHFVVFLTASLGLVIISKVLMQNEPARIIGLEWWIWVIFIWLLALLYHAFKVFVTQRLLGPEWEKKQYDRLVHLQQKKVAQLESQVAQENTAPATSETVEATVGIPHERTITMIAAVDGNLGLGRNNDLVWHLPDDFRRFKEMTMGHHIIMGRKTFESFKKPLPGRPHIIITNNREYKTEHGTVVHSMEDALAAVGDDENPFIIGGGEIYKLGLPYADRLELTQVHEVFDVDTYFPEFSRRQFKLLRTEHHPADERHKYPFDYETWARKK